MSQKKVEKWTKIKESIAFKGFRVILSRFFELPNGNSIEYHIKDEGQGAACALALTCDNQVILARQFRPGPEKILLELPGGMIDEGETPEEAISREFLEETGYSGIVQLVGRNYVCAYSTLYRYNFVITECKKVQEPNTDDNEATEVVLMSLDDFRNHLRSGQLTDVETGYLGLDHLELL